MSGVRRMPPSARHQVQVFLSMRGTPSRLAHGGPAEPRGVVEPPPPPVEPSAPSNVETASPTRVEETVPQTTQATPSGAAAAQTATPSVRPQQVPVPSCRAVASIPNIPLILPSRRRFRCLKSRDQEDVQSHAFCQYPVQWSTRKDAQNAGETVTITTHNANVELPIEQQLHLTGEVNTNEGLPTVQPVHLTWEVQHLVWEVPCQFKQQVKLPVEQRSHLRLEVFQIKFKLRLPRESKPRRSRQQFMRELRTKKHSCSSSSGSCE